MAMIIDAEGHNRWVGKYRAFVVDAADPDQQFRLKLRIPEVLQDEESAWALPAFPPIGEGLPAVGDMVWAEFESGKPSQPIWGGRIISAKDGDKPATPLARGESDDTVHGPMGRIPMEIDENTTINQPPPAFQGQYGDDGNRVFRTPGGHLIEMDDTPGEERVRIRHSAGGLVEIVKDGSIRIFGMNLDQTIRRAFRQHIEGTETKKVEGPSVQVYADDVNETYQGRHTVDHQSELVETVRGQSTRTVGGKRRENAQGAFEMNAGGSMQIQSAGEFKLGTGGNAAHIIGGNLNILVANSFLDTTAINIQAVLGNARISANAGILDMEGILMRLGGVLGVHPLLLGEVFIALLLPFLSGHTHPVSGVTPGGGAVVSDSPTQAVPNLGAALSFRSFTA